MLRTTLRPSLLRAAWVAERNRQGRQVRKMDTIKIMWKHLGDDTYSVKIPEGTLYKSIERDTIYSPYSQLREEQIVSVSMCFVPDTSQ
jgi:hypothetical protein